MRQMRLGNKGAGHYSRGEAEARRKDGVVPVDNVRETAYSSKWRGQALLGVGAAFAIILRRAPLHWTFHPCERQPAGSFPGSRLSPCPWSAFALPVPFAPMRWQVYWGISRGSPQSP